MKQILFKSFALMVSFTMLVASNSLNVFANENESFNDIRVMSENEIEVDNYEESLFIEKYENTEDEELLIEEIENNEINTYGYSTYNYYNSASDYQYACTYIAWNTVKERLGVELPLGWGNAGTWYNNAPKDGYKTYPIGTTPKAGWLVVWQGPSGSAGHVAYITGVDTSNGRISIHEGGSGWSGNVHGVLDRTTNIGATEKQNWNGTNYTLSMVGYIDPIKNPLLQLPIAVRNSDFYATLLKNEGWKNVGAVNSNVELVNGEAANAIWHFVKQSDGLYVIYNCASGKALSVSGSNVVESPYSGGDNQKWIIRGQWSGEYVLSPKLYINSLVLDVMNNGSSAGTNVLLAGYNGSGAQKFAIYEFPGVGSSYLSYTLGSSTTETRLTWTNAANATSYNLRIKSGILGSTSTYKDVWNLTGTSYSIVLPAGYYEVYVDSCNYYSYLSTNVIKFTVPSAPKQTITFNVNGGNSISPTTKSVEKNGKYGTLPTPTRSGYTFIGWFTAPSGGTSVTENTVCTGDTTIYAHWEKILNNQNGNNSGDIKGENLYRFSRPDGGDWLITCNKDEIDVLKAAGWKNDGKVGNVAPWGNGVPVYRFSNSITNDRMFSDNDIEIENYNAAKPYGWVNEGIAFYYNPKASIEVTRYATFEGLHIWSTDPAEQKNFDKAGWKREGQAFRVDWVN